MQNLLYPNGCTLFVGAESEHQSTVAHEAVFDALVQGASVIALSETKGDVEAFKAYARLWLRAHQRNPELNDRVHGLANYRSLREPAILADAIVRAAQRPGQTLKSARDGEGFVVLSDRARDMLAANPGDHRIGVCADLVDHLPNARIVVTAHHGPAAMPPPALTLYRSQRVWRVQAARNRITVSEVKPGSERHDFVPVNLAGGILKLGPWKERSYA